MVRYVEASIPLNDSVGTTSSFHSLRRMVIDHIQCITSMPASWKARTIAELPEYLLDHIARRRRKAQRKVVSPEIFQSFIEQMPIVRGTSERVKARRR